jgi:hypothetical protein
MSTTTTTGRTARPGRDDEGTLGRERRWGRPAGVAALLSVAATIGTVMLASAATGGSAAPKGGGFSDAPIDRAQHLRDFRAHHGELVTSTGLRCLGLMLMAAIGVYLYRLVRTRDPGAIRPFVLWLTFLAPVLVAASTVLGFVAYGAVADEFARTGGGTTARAKELIDASGSLRLANLTDPLSRVVVAIWLAFLATSAMRVGLLTRFLGYWGVAAAASLVILPIGDAMLAGWIGSMGFLALGFWPGGRPAAWDSTEPQEIEAI